MDFEFRPRVGVTVLAILIAATFVTLATWQMSRFLEKSQQEDEWNARQRLEPAALRSLENFDAGALDYRRVIAEGVLDDSRRALYDNTRFRAEPGCLVASPLALVDGGTIIVVRGFAPHTPSQRCDDAPLSPPGSGPWHALVHTLSPNLADQPHRSQTGAHLRWDTFDVVGTYSAWQIDDGPPTPTVLVLDESHVGDPFPLASFEHVSAPYLTSMRHLNYAGTWLLLLLGVVGVWGGLSLKRVDAAA